MRNIQKLITGFLLCILLGTNMPQDAQAQFFAFGKNRVQYADFDWRYIQSEHFDIYYYDAQNYYLAEFTAYSLEAALRQLSIDFRHEINDRISVIIYDSHVDFSQTNVVPLPVNSEGIGGVTDKFKNRITIPFMGNYADYRQVLHHELVHAVFNDMFYGGTIQSIVQNNIQLFFPLWFEEGLAEFTSLGWDTDTDMFMRDLVVSGFLIPIQQMGGFLAYRGGQAFWYFITDVYGREKIGEILQRIKTTRSLEAGLRQSLGLNFTELNERFHDWLKKRYWPEVERRESLRDFATHLTVRDLAGSFNTSPAISPQGDRIALITNKRGYFDVVVMNAVTGRVEKTLIRGNDNVDFEELNILRPNLTWSPQGDQLALSTRSGGSIDLAIVDYESGDIKRIKFPNLSSIGSVAWSPDGDKIAFQANRGPYTDIYVYNLKTQDFLNLTNDVFSDRDPSWSLDSRYVYFTSDRGSRTDLGTYRTNFNVLLNPYLEQTDLYRVRIGQNRAERLTSTPGWNEHRPIEISGQRMIYISDQNGIPNVYLMDLETRHSRPVTDLLVGVNQMSINADGTRLAVNTYNRGFLDIFLINNPLTRVKDEELVPNRWAQERARTPKAQRVPAHEFAHLLFNDGRSHPSLEDEQLSTILTEIRREQEERRAARAEETTETRVPDRDVVDFRNYVFGDVFDEIVGEEERNLFDPVDNMTEDGRFRPRNYRLNFSPDFTYFGGGFTVGGYGSFALTQLVFSDLLGDHRFGIASNLIFDLRNSDYIINYGYFKRRTNYVVNYFHTARNFQTFNRFGEIQLERFRYYGGGATIQYPFDKFTRVDFTLNHITVSRDLNNLNRRISENTKRFFVNPEVTFTRDFTMPGFLTPISGYRYAIRLSSAPPIPSSDYLSFTSLVADGRYYIRLGNTGMYTLALRGSGGASIGENAQNFLLGGMQNWINFQTEGGTIPSDVLESIFFTLPALPMRGHNYYASVGDMFALGNFEFRFPLIAALLPGPIPIIPLYNIQGTAFVDVGTTWREFENDRVLAGAGFGLRTILLGLPFRYDLAWPYEFSSDADLGRSRGFGSRIHYFSIGIDF